LLVQLDVEPCHARVGKTAVGIERLDALQVRVEPRTVEEIFFAPGNFRALAGGECVLQPPLVNGVDAVERQAVNLDRAGLLAGSARGDDEEARNDRQTHGWHYTTITCASRRANKRPRRLF